MLTWEIISFLVGILTTNINATNGVLTACLGDFLSINCTHGEGSLTRWVFSSLPSQCIVSHDDSQTTCGPFTITTSNSGSSVSSSAQITASASLNGTVVDCRAGGLITSPLVGNITINTPGNLVDFIKGNTNSRTT